MMGGALQSSDTFKNAATAGTALSAPKKNWYPLFNKDKNAG